MCACVRAGVRACVYEGVRWMSGVEWLTIRPTERMAARLNQPLTRKNNRTARTDIHWPAACVCACVHMPVCVHTSGRVSQWRAATLNTVAR